MASSSFDPASRRSPSSWGRATSPSRHMSHHPPEPRALSPPSSANRRPRRPLSPRTPLHSTAAGATDDLANTRGQWQGYRPTPGGGGGASPRVIARTFPLATTSTAAAAVYAPSPDPWPVRGGTSPRPAASRSRSRSPQPMPESATSAYRASSGPPRSSAASPTQGDLVRGMRTLQRPPSPPAAGPRQRDVDPNAFGAPNTAIPFPAPPSLLSPAPASRLPSAMRSVSPSGASASQKLIDHGDRDQSAQSNAYNDNNGDDDEVLRALGIDSSSANDRSRSGMAPDRTMASPSPPPPPRRQRYRSRSPGPTLRVIAADDSTSTSPPPHLPQGAPSILPPPIMSPTPVTHTTTHVDGGTLPPSPESPYKPPTPRHKKILRKLHSAVGLLSEGERAVDAMAGSAQSGRISPTRDATSPSGTNSTSSAALMLRQVIELVETVLDVTLVSSDHQQQQQRLDMNSIEKTLYAWKRRSAHLHESYAQRRQQQQQEADQLQPYDTRSPSPSRVSLADRAGHNPKSPSALTADVLDARKLAARYKSQVDDLTSELQATKTDHTRQKAAWEQRHANTLVELDRARAQVAHREQQATDQVDELWDHVAQVEAALDARADECRQQAAAVATQTAELERMAGDMARVEAEAAEVARAAEDAHREAAALREDKQRLEAAARTADRERQELVDQLRVHAERQARASTSVRDVHQEQMKCESLAAELAEAQRRRAVAFDEVAAVRRELDLVSRQLADANAREDDVRDKLRTAEATRAETDTHAKEARDVAARLKSSMRKRDEDYFAAKRLLEAQEAEAKDHAQRYAAVAAERDQLAIMRRELEHQVNTLRGDHERHVASARVRDHELGNVRAELRDAHETIAELKKQNALLSTVRTRAEREKKDADDKCAVTAANLRSAEEALKSTRKDLEAVTLQRLHLEQRCDKLQAKIQEATTRHDDTKRDLSGARQNAEAREKQLATLEMQWKQVLADNKDLAHRVKTLDERLSRAHTDMDVLAKRAAGDTDAYNEKLTRALEQLSELDKQLIQAKTSLQLTADERNRLVDDNKKLLHRVEKYQGARSAADDRLNKVLQERDKYERRVRELAKYKTLYSSVIEAGLLIDRSNPVRISGPTGAASASNHNGDHGNAANGGARSPTSPRSADGQAASSVNGGNAIDWDVLAEHQLLLTRCRRIVQSAARYTTFDGSDSVATDNLTTTEDLLEALEAVMSALCRQAARGARASPGASTSSNPHKRVSGITPLDTSATKPSSTSPTRVSFGAEKSAAATSEVLVQLQRHFISSANKLRASLASLADHRFLEDDVVGELDMAISSLTESLPYYSSSEERSGYASSSSPRHPTGSSSAPAAPMTASTLQACVAILKLSQSTVANLTDLVQAKFKTVAGDIQNRTDQHIQALKSENNALKDKVAQFSVMSDRLMRAHQRDKERYAASAGPRD
ncbi:hypothetical protein BC828DRAFT_379954 [Blastocladiella britannica]|nr:hypothetical protein BC828DRAFT_379954 [Blastocladiella britannica]